MEWLCSCLCLKTHPRKPGRRRREEEEEKGKAKSERAGEEQGKEGRKHEVVGML